MKRKIIAIMLSAAIGLSLLTGCGDGSENTGADSNSSAADSAAESTDADKSDAGGGEVLNVICVGTEADTHVAGYNKIAENFSADNEYGVTIQFDFYENEQFKTKLTTLMASNAVPDIFFTWELSYLQPFVEGGKVADITSYLEEDQEWKNSFAGGTLDKLSYDGKNYGIPTQKSLCVMFYNKQIFEENGVSVPTTYDEFLQVCETLKANGVTPMAMCGTDAWIPA
ncbi:MAG: extracellular solute-binding protein, partial [Lachnospiraceae bacterium]|nr:extracellular solute-binding protein [Lachnospiraceae bacterium]